MYSRKSNLVSLLLCIFFGYLGIHRFYVGKVGTGLLMLFTAGLGGVWVIVDIIIIILGKFRDKEGYQLKF
ncbi:TM2 domain-containing membrane protein YozV [Paenibacillus sp. SORGH_AS306]|uniref:TM2 domain-containing protein n=1 Tax=Paenibacillus kyungheensis TaxID=1452732 RepID=A0AAX3M145_9BACL|nr:MULTISPECIES: TM2 domain-containing protein [Paenibacillus]MDQ1236193.1 TM2 domain-containing membrane protein YozV [Paenibacillus sp. SORGH_AS_0306]MDR6108548.1 TM2 domain-containing membrane protein YozV [Paenibacillus sp. SORGH_AS_0338]WCT55635.1 TM2 domain-containing protein [Paenibacillus kyungheensis]WDF51197.1 TM2 domain-containing protein [Paenibacillus sp. KACC 21273]